MLKELVRTVVPKGLHPAELAKKRVLRLSCGKVLGGPFAGMVSITAPDDFHDYSMLLGTYEMELRDVIERVCANPPDLIVDVGAAQGYYAVGFALRCPAARVIAFESTESGREQMKRAAHVNNVDDRVEIRGHCDHAALNEALTGAGRTLVFMDIEGGEKELLDPELVPALKTCEIVLEEHSNRVPGLDELMESRFRPTHRLVLYHADDRHNEDLPREVPPGWNWWTTRLMSEGRAGSMGWFHMLPRGAD